MRCPDLFCPRGKLPRLWLVLLLLPLSGGWGRASPPAVSPEYQVKAVFLFNFAQFVEWPPEAFADPADPLIIGVLGEDPFGSSLDETLQGESIRDRTLVIRRWQKVEDIDHCHILFISASEASRFAPVLGRLAGRPILTVGDIEGFAKAGGMIRLLTENKRTRLRINLDAAREAGLVISSKLLRPAEIISGKEGTR